MKQYPLDLVSGFDEHEGSKKEYLDMYGVKRPCCRRLFMSPSSTILTKQSNECVFNFTEEKLKAAAMNPYKGGNTFLKFVRSNVEADLIVTQESDEPEQQEIFHFIEDEVGKVYSTIPGIPVINKEAKKRVPNTESVVIMEYVDREYLVF